MATINLNYYVRLKMFQNFDGLNAKWETGP